MSTSRYRPDHVDIEVSPSIGSNADSSTNDDRLSIPSTIRVPAATMMGLFAGLGLGLSYGGRMAGMRFRAENSHRFPTSQTGWYLYHKSKNYHIMLAGIKEGMKMGSKVSLWTCGFFVIEDYLDKKRGTKDLVSTAVAGLSIAGTFSLWNRFPPLTTMRTLKTGLYGGLAFGLAQDLLGLARGRRPRYADVALSWINSKGADGHLKS